jgi:hypothetical protein
MEWHEAIEFIEPYVVKISTPRGSGTGFLVSTSNAAPVCAVATAAHVIDNAHYWEEPIRILHYQSSQSIVLRPDDRAVFLKEEIDTGAIAFDRSLLPLPDKGLELTPDDKHFKPGVEIGWVGFPAIAASTLCFFSGRISSWLEDRSSYLLDGVAINGVSGGPAFLTAGKKFIAMGVVSAYIPNRATGDTLPGLCEIRDVLQFQEIAQQFKDLDDAKQQESSHDTTPDASETDTHESA